MATKAFDPLNPKHVLWLKELSTISEAMKVTDPLEQEKAMRKLDLTSLLKKNPMKVAIDPLEFPMTHFGLAMLYTNAVFKGLAWIPDPSQDTRQA